jgi:hypothetical protein
VFAFLPFSLPHRLPVRTSSPTLTSVPPSSHILPVSPTSRSNVARPDLSLFVASCLRFFPLGLRHSRALQLTVPSPLWPPTVRYLLPLTVSSPFGLYRLCIHAPSSGASSKSFFVCISLTVSIHAHHHTPFESQTKNKKVHPSIIIEKNYHFFLFLIPTLPVVEPLTSFTPEVTLIHYATAPSDIVKIRLGVACLFIPNEPLA